MSRQIQNYDSLFTESIKKNTEVEGVVYKAGSKITWFSKDRLKVHKGILATDQWVKGKPLKKDHSVIYYKSGEVFYSAFSQNTEFYIGQNKVSVKKGDTFRGWPNGGLLRVYLNKDLTWKESGFEFHIDKEYTGQAGNRLSTPVVLTPKGYLFSAGQIKNFSFKYLGRMYNLEYNTNVRWHATEYPRPRSGPVNTRCEWHEFLADLMNDYKKPSSPDIINLKENLKLGDYTVKKGGVRFHHGSDKNTCGHIRWMVPAFDIIIEGTKYPAGKAISFNEDGSINTSKVK